MAKGKIYLGLDIGFNSVKITSLRRSGNRVVVDNAGVIELTPEIEKRDLKERCISIKHALKVFLSEEEVSGVMLNVSIPGQNIFTRFITLPAATKDKISKIIKYEAQQQVPFAEEDVVWSYNSSRRENELEVLFVAVKKAISSQLLCIESSKPEVTLDCIDAAPVAIYNAIKYFQSPDESKPFVLLDIGAEVTNIIIFRNEKLWSRTIFIGGADITKSIAKRMNLSLLKAEEVKKAANYLQPEESAADRRIVEAVNTVMVDLIGEINHSLGYYRNNVDSSVQLEEVKVTGGGSRLKGIKKYLSENIGMEVSDLDILSDASEGPISGISDDDKSRLGVSLGLALREWPDLVPIKINLLPPEAINVRSFRSKVGAIVTSLLIACAVMLTLNLGIRNENLYRVSNMDRTGGISEQQKYLSDQSAYRKLKSDIRDLYRDMQKYSKALDTKRWSLYLKEITALLPEGTYIQSIIQKGDSDTFELHGMLKGPLPEISDFGDSLKRSGSFDNVDIVSAGIAEDPVSAERGYKEFRLRIKVK